MGKHISLGCFTGAVAILGVTILSSIGYIISANREGNSEQERMREYDSRLALQRQIQPYANTNGDNVITFEELVGLYTEKGLIGKDEVLVEGRDKLPLPDLESLERVFEELKAGQ